MAALFPILINGIVSAILLWLNREDQPRLVRAPDAECLHFWRKDCVLQYFLILLLGTSYTAQFPLSLSELPWSSTSTDFAALQEVDQGCCGREQMELYKAVDPQDQEKEQLEKTSRKVLIYSLKISPFDLEKHFWSDINLSIKLSF